MRTEQPSSDSGPAASTTGDSRTVNFSEEVGGKKTRTKVKMGPSASKEDAAHKAIEDLPQAGALNA